MLFACKNRHTFVQNDNSKKIKNLSIKPDSQGFALYEYADTYRRGGATPPRTREELSTTLSKVFHNFSHNSLWQKLWETGRHGLWATLWAAPETLSRPDPSGLARKLQILGAHFFECCQNGSQFILKAAHMENLIAGSGQDRVHKGVPLLPGLSVVAAVIQL